MSVFNASSFSILWRYLKSLFETTGPNVMTKVRQEVEELSKAKNLHTDFELLSPSNNVKVVMSSSAPVFTLGRALLPQVELVAHCRAVGANYVIVGPGKDCSGRMAEWLCGWPCWSTSICLSTSVFRNVRGATVVAVRDHCRWSGSRRTWRILRSAEWLLLWYHTRLRSYNI